MISKLLYAIELGFQRVRANTKLLFIVIVLFVFPFLIIVVVQQFSDTAGANIQTAELQSTNALHSSVAAVLQVAGEATVNELLSTLGAESSDITSLRLYEASGTEVTIVASKNQEEIGATSSITTVLQLGKVEPGQTFSVPLTSSLGRIEQSVRYTPYDGVEYYIFSEHSRYKTDVVFAKRQQDAYLLLTLFFGFFIGLAFWVSRQVDAEKRYQKIKNTLEERDLFTNMIAHEFRTPLTAIKGYASFLQESKSMTMEEIRFADTIRESAERLVLLVNDFLEIARIQSGKLKIDQKPVDLREPITTVAESLLEEASAKGLQLVYTPDLKPQLLETDPNRFIQILTNIVSNSIKYTDSGTVEISCESERSGIIIRVKDTGMGISAEDQEKLFSPFSRVGGVEKTTTTGTGLGMWITKQMIELLRGEIAVESIKGVGTHVVMKFKHPHH